MKILSCDLISNNVYEKDGYKAKKKIVLFPASKAKKLG
jgi:hypothetical protein